MYLGPSRPRSGTGRFDNSKLQPWRKIARRFSQQRKHRGGRLGSTEGNARGIRGSCGGNVSVERRRRDAETVHDLSHADVGIGEHCPGGLDVVPTQTPRLALGSDRNGASAVAVATAPSGTPDCHVEEVGPLGIALTGQHRPNGVVRLPTVIAAEDCKLVAHRRCRPAEHETHPAVIARRPRPSPGQAAPRRSRRRGVARVGMASLRSP